MRRHSNPQCISLVGLHLILSNWKLKSKLKIHWKLLWLRFLLREVPSLKLGLWLFIYTCKSPLDVVVTMTNMHVGTSLLSRKFHTCSSQMIKKKEPCNSSSNHLSCRSKEENKSVETLGSTTGCIVYMCITPLWLPHTVKQKGKLPHWPWASTQLT